MSGIMCTFTFVSSPVLPKYSWLALWRCVSESSVLITRTVLSPSTTWRHYTQRGGSTRQLKTCTRRRWTFAKEPCPRTIPRWPTRSNTWPCCINAGWDACRAAPLSRFSYWLRNGDEHVCCVHRESWKRLLRCMSCLWRSGKKVSAPNTPVWPQLWSTWLWSTAS